LVQKLGLVSEFLAAAWREIGLRRFICHGYGPKQNESRSYDADGSFQRTLSLFADETKHNPTHVESHDANDQVETSTDYEYEFDTYGNWTKRSVWVWTQELGERKLHEIDSRTLVYWK
jgi:hypothetical protein